MNIETAKLRLQEVLSGPGAKHWAFSPAVKALLDELEKSQRANAGQDDHINQQADLIESLEQKNAGLGKALQAAEKRIAELQNDEVRQRLANAEHQLHMAELAKHNLKASRKAQFRKRIAAERRIAELEAEKAELRPVGVMSEKAFYRLEQSESRFIALWPRPGIHSPRKRPHNGVIVYARVAAAGIGRGA
ncbi:TPA: hypothetical protein ACS5PI_002032 [Salmonella enterica subsp. enterica]